MRSHFNVQSGPNLIIEAELMIVWFKRPIWPMALRPADSGLSAREPPGQRYLVDAQIAANDIRGTADNHCYSEAAAKKVQYCPQLLTVERVD